MAQILLVDFDRPLGEQVARLLQERGHRVADHSTDCPVVKTPWRHLAGLDLVIVDVSLDDATIRKHLVLLVDYREQHGGRPMLLCVSTVYRGPRFEMDLEKKGARLVYL